MKTQLDTTMRVVSARNLRALCERVSGHCHTYAVDNISRSRATVVYSNPDEYGAPRPVKAIYPVIPNTAQDRDTNPLIVLGHMIRVLGGDDQSDQSFDVLLDHPPLYFNPNTNEWETKAEILMVRAIKYVKVHDIGLTEDDIYKAVQYLVYVNKGHTWDSSRLKIAEDVLNLINPGFYTKRWASNYTSLLQENENG